jgi:hypothetical protein
MLINPDNFMGMLLNTPILSTGRFGGKSAVVLIIGWFIDLLYRAKYYLPPVK